MSERLTERDRRRTEAETTQLARETMQHIKLLGTLDSSKKAKQEAVRLFSPLAPGLLPSFAPPSRRSIGLFWAVCCLPYPLLVWFHGCVSAKARLTRGGRRN